MHVAVVGSGDLETGQEFILSSLLTPPPTQNLSVFLPPLSGHSHNFGIFWFLLEARCYAVCSLTLIWASVDRQLLSLSG